MSIGFCGRAILEAADDAMLLYFYYACNTNNTNYKEYFDKYDGEIIIKRKTLVEPEKYLKRIRKPSGRKVFKERVRIKEVDMGKLLSNGDVEIHNASGTWQLLDNGYDFMAIRLLHKIFKEYQEKCDIPEDVSIFY